MKRIISYFLILTFISFNLQIVGVSASQLAEASNDNDQTDVEEQFEPGEEPEIEDEEPPMEDIADEDPTDEVERPEGGHDVILHYFNEGGNFMIPVLICLILGLAIAFERIINLNLKSINTRKFISDIEKRLQQGNADDAMELCRNTRGPIASIFYQALDRRNEGTDIVEKSIVSYGSVQMGLLEKGLVWLSLFISLAPMLGFMGTVIGMILAFDAIEAAGDINPSLVAGGIKIALLTTVAGLIVAVILQIFYNYAVSKIDNLVNKMEDASITLIDMMLKYNIIKEKNNA